MVSLIPRGPSYVFLLSDLRVLAVPPISRGPSNIYVFSCPMGIGGDANTREALMCICTLKPVGIGCAANTLGGPHMYLYLHT